MNNSDEELAYYLNLTVDEVRKKEIEILTLLKNNDSIKVMRKKLWLVLFYSLYFSRYYVNL